MTKQMSNVKVWALVAALTVPVAAAAQQATAVGGIQVQAQDRYVVGRAMPPDVPGSPRVDLTLEGAIARALEKNLDIQSARLAPLMQDYSMQASRAAFRPTVNGNFSYNNSSSQSTSQLDGGARVTSTTNTFNGSMTQRLPWYGGQLSFNLNNSRAVTDNSFQTRNPNFSSTLNFGYTQPLLANRKIDSQRNGLLTGEIQRQVEDVKLQSQIENIKNAVRTAYWALRQSIEAIEIQRRALDQQRRQLADNKIKVEVGTMAEIDLVQLDSAIASGEQSLLASEIAWRNAELTFKRLLVDSASDEFYKSTINPVDQATFELQSVDIPAAVARAIAQRTDIEQARQQLRIGELNLELSHNAVKPTLNMSASYQLRGIGGNLYNRSGLGGTAVLIEESGYFDALKSIARFDTPTWQVGLTFSKPLGISASRANYMRSKLSLDQQKTTLKGTELNIETEVIKAGLDVQSTYKQLLAAQKTREAAEKTLEAELTRFQVGMSTNFQVVTFQNSLTSARNNELSATIRYINAVAEFDRVQKFGR